MNKLWRDTIELTRIIGESITRKERVVTCAHCGTSWRVAITSGAPFVVYGATASTCPKCKRTNKL